MRAVVRENCMRRDAVPLIDGILHLGLVQRDVPDAGCAQTRLQGRELSAVDTFLIVGITPAAGVARELAYPENHHHDERLYSHM